MIPVKRNIPETKSRLFVRTHLMKMLDEGLNFPITLMTAGAGYGKSTALGEWAKDLDHSITWLSLDQHDNEVIPFWLHVIDSMDHVLMREEKSDIMKIMNKEENIPSILPLLLNGLRHCSEELVFIVDDFHVINNGFILTDFSSLLQRLPAHVHIYLASRTSCSLSLSKLRLQGQINEIHPSNMRMDIQETTLFFNQCADVNVNNKMVKTLLEQTEGWITGMRLIAILMDQFTGQDVEEKDAIMDLTPNNSLFIQYFLDEIVQKQRADVQYFLMRTAVLDKINVALAEAVTGLKNTPSILKYLKDKNLFLVSLDSDNQWYRYHHLFGEFLQLYWQDTKPLEMQKAHMLAGEWMYDHDYPMEAVDHFVQAGDYDQAMRLLHHMLKTTPVHELLTWLGWLQEIPNHQLFKYRELYLMHIPCLYLAGRREQARSKYWWAIDYLEANRNEMNEQETVYFQAGLNFSVAVSAYFEEKFDTFIACSEKYINYYPNGKLLVNFGIDQQGYHMAWEIFISEYDLLKAEKQLTRLLALWSKTANALFYAHLCVDFAKLNYEKNALHEAKKYGSMAFDIAQKHSNAFIMVNSQSVLAQICLAENKMEEMYHHMEKFMEVSYAFHYDSLIKRSTFLRNVLLLKIGNPLKTKEWLESSRLSKTDELSSTKIDEYLVLAQYKGIEENYTDALCLTERLTLLLGEKMDYRSYIQLYLQMGILYYLQGNLDLSFQQMEKALGFANHAGYIRTIIDNGWKTQEVLEAFVQAVQQHHYFYKDKSAFDYAKGLLPLFHPKNMRQKKKHGQPQKLLTLKEQIVLTYIRDGMTNREIAEELHVSLATVKTHINNLYRKLNAKSRITALQIAQEFHLINQND